MNEYIHVKLKKYNDELEEHSATVDKHCRTEREQYFNKTLKTNIEKEFSKFNKPFLIIHVGTDGYKQRDRYVITYNNFNVVYHHNRYDSRVDVFVTEIYTNKPIYLGMNCMIMDEFDENVKLSVALMKQLKYSKD